MTDVSIDGAKQVLRPPEPGLPYIRHDHAHELITTAASVAIHAGRIAAFETDPAADLRIDARDCAVVPGLVDCHTHLPFAGWRSEEYEQKVTGVPYEEIARKGGGIRSSARALASSSDETVLTQAGGLAAEMLVHGTTMFECKSGYGLTVGNEMRLLALAERLRRLVPQKTTSTALLAHSIPDGYSADGWVDVVAEMVPSVAANTSATALDIYVESVAFDNSHLRRMGELAAGAGLDLRAHVEQFNQNRSVPVALEYNARSVDHLARLHPDDLELLADSECAAVLLPGAEFLGDEAVAPARSLADAGAICVLATDANPGTSPIVSLPLIVGLAARRYGWSVLEALLAVTLNAAWVLRHSDELGSIEIGKAADLVILDAEIERIPYRFGHNPVLCVLIDGRVAYLRPGSEWRVSTR